MIELFTIDNLANLGVLIFLQAVLGFDNLLYISIESKRAPAHQQAAVRRWGIIIAVALRIILLFVMIKLINTMTAPFFHLTWTGVIEGTLTSQPLYFCLAAALLCTPPLRKYPICSR